MAGIADWNGFTQAVAVIELLIAGYCLFRLVKPFLQNVKTALAAGGMYFLTMLFLHILPSYIPAFTAYAMGSLAAFLAMCGRERKNPVQKAFLAVTYFSLRWFTAAIAEFLYDKLYYFVENTAWYRGHPTTSMQFMVYAGVCTFYLLMVFLITNGAVRCITKSYIYKYEQMEKRELFLLAVPPFLGALGYEIIRYYRIFYIRENGKTPEAYDMMLLSYCGVAIMVVVILIVLYQNIKAAQKEISANRMISNQIDTLKRHMEQVEDLYQDIRSMKHDMTNHVLTLERLYAENKTKETRDYVRDMKAALMETAGGIASGNPVTDVILREWKTEAEKKNIQFRCDFYYPVDSNINAFDVSVILNNALQNALENTKNLPAENMTDNSIESAGKSGTPHISVLSYHRNNAYMIEVSNSFSGSLQWDKERDLPVTSKEKTEGHGYGLFNIRMVAGKYSGDIAIDLKDDEFRLSIMLMME